MKTFRNILFVLVLVLSLNIGFGIGLCQGDVEDPEPWSVEPYVSIEDPEPWSIEPIEIV